MYMEHPIGVYKWWRNSPSVISHPKTQKYINVDTEWWIIAQPKTKPPQKGRTIRHQFQRQLGDKHNAHKSKMPNLSDNFGITLPPLNFNLLI